MADGALRGYGVLVTGGGTGIGRACAEALAVDGAVVTICGRTESSLTDAVDTIAPGYGGRVHHVVADVTSEDDATTYSEYLKGRTLRKEEIRRRAIAAKKLAKPPIVISPAID